MHPCNILVTGWSRDAQESLGLGDLCLLPVGRAPAARRPWRLVRATAVSTESKSLRLLGSQTTILRNFQV